MADEEYFRCIDFGKKEVCKYIGYIIDREHIVGEGSITNIYDENKKVVVETFHINVRDNVFIDVKVAFDLGNNRELIPKRVDVEYKNQHGKIINQEMATFDKESYRLYWDAETIIYPPRTYPLLTPSLFMRGIDFNSNKLYTFNSWLAHHVFWPVRFKVVGKVKLEVPAGVFECYKIRIVPEFQQVFGFLFSLIEPLIPGMYIYFTVEDPHYFVKFDFPTSFSLWGKRGKIELKEIIKE